MVALRVQCGQSISDLINADGGFTTFIKVIEQYKYKIQYGDRSTVANVPVVYMHVLPNERAYVGSTTQPVNRWAGNLQGYSDEFRRDMARLGGPDNVQTYWSYVPKYINDGLECIIIERGRFTDPYFGYNIMLPTIDQAIEIALDKRKRTLLYAT